MVIQADLFTAEQRPEEDDFLLEIVDRFDGVITAIGPLTNGSSSMWIEIIRPLAERRPRRASVAHGGRPRTVQLDETVLLGRFSSYEKAKRKGSARPWQVQWEDGTAMGIGLFSTREFADAYRSRR